MEPDLLQRLTRIETALSDLLRQRTAKEYYSTEDMANILGKSSFTVREWCRLGRIHASKRLCGRGTSQEWIVSHEELTRFQKEGLLPRPTTNQEEKPRCARVNGAATLKG